MQTIEQIAVPLLRHGYEPLPITPGEKVPYIRNWTRITIDEDKLRSWRDRMKSDDYVGLRCGRLVGLDVDIDDADVTQLVIDDAHFTLGDSPIRRGKPGRGLLVYRAEMPFPKKRLALTDPQGREHHVEVLAQGQQFVAYGEHPGSGRAYEWEGGDPLAVPLDSLEPVSEAELNDWLDSLADILPDGWSVGGAETFDDEERWLLRYRPPRDEADMAPAELLEHRALGSLADWVPELLPEAREYQDGYRITSKALGRDLQEDLQLSPDGIYDFGEERGRSALEVVACYACDGDLDAAKAWLAERLGINLEAQRQAVESRRDEESQLVMWQQRIDEAAGVDRLQKIADAVGRNVVITPVERDALAKIWQERFKEIAGTAVGIASVRKQMAPSVKRSSVEDMPEWCRGWYYITHTDQFFRYGSTQWVSTQGFNALFQREMAPDEDQRRPSAHRVALDDFKLPVVEVGIYAPHLGETFTMSGRQCVNTFMPDSIPAPDETISPEGKEAVDRLNRHIWNLCGHREGVYRSLLDWITYAVQNPGLKIRFSPLVKGVEGDGKTVLLQVLAVCLGQPNVRSVTPQVLMSQFNGYAEGVCAVGLEEIRMAGHNRHDAMNAMKPLITNDTVDIHKKGQDSYNALNTVNYIAFTNHSDALPISATDRRWMVIYTPWASLKEMREVVGQEPEEYFTALHDAINQNGGAIRHWLTQRPLSETFNPNGPAPSSPEKEAMRLADLDDAEELLEEVIKIGAEGVSGEVVSTKHLTDALMSEQFGYVGAAEIPHGRGLSKMLQRLGWSRYPKQVKWGGHPCRVWVKNLRTASNDSIRQALDMTTEGQGAPEEQIPF